MLDFLWLYPSLTEMNITKLEFHGWQRKKKSCSEITKMLTNGEKIRRQQRRTKRLLQHQLSSSRFQSVRNITRALLLVMQLFQLKSHPQRKNILFNQLKQQHTITLFKFSWHVHCSLALEQKNGFPLSSSLSMASICFSSNIKLSIIFTART